MCKFFYSTEDLLLINQDATRPKLHEGSVFLYFFVFLFFYLFMFVMCTFFSFPFFRFYCLLFFSLILSLFLPFCIFFCSFFHNFSFLLPLPLPLLLLLLLLFFFFFLLIFFFYCFFFRFFFFIFFFFSLFYFFFCFFCFFFFLSSSSSSSSSLCSLHLSLVCYNTCALFTFSKHALTVFNCMFLPCLCFSLWNFRPTKDLGWTVYMLLEQYNSVSCTYHNQCIILRSDLKEL